MNKANNNLKNDSDSTCFNGRYGRIAILVLMVGMFGLLLGSLMHPSEAAQNYEGRLINLERRLDQFQYAVDSLDRGMTQIESRTFNAAPPASQLSTTDIRSLEQRETLIVNRMDELQNQIQTQGKMLTELRKMIADKEKTEPKEEKKEPQQQKKPTTGRPKP